MCRSASHAILNIVRSTLSSIARTVVPSPPPHVLHAVHERAADGDELGRLFARGLVDLHLGDEELELRGTEREQESVAVGERDDRPERLVDVRARGVHLLRSHVGVGRLLRLERVERTQRRAERAHVVRELGSGEGRVVALHARQHATVGDGDGDVFGGRGAREEERPEDERGPRAGRAPAGSHSRRSSLGPRRPMLPPPHRTLAREVRAVQERRARSAASHEARFASTRARSSAGSARASRRRQASTVASQSPSLAHAAASSSSARQAWISW